MHDDPATPPSPWVLRFAPLIPVGAPALDLACGGGRHTRLLLSGGHPVVAVDRDVSGMGWAVGLHGVEVRAADLERGGPFPLAGRSFGGIVVTNYLHRALFPALVAGLAAGGVLLYETFAEGNAELGHRVRNPDFLLRHGELLEVAAVGGLRVVAYEDVVEGTPPSVAVQRICAVREPGPWPGVCGEG